MTTEAPEKPTTKGDIVDATAEKVEEAVAGPATIDPMTCTCFPLGGMQGTHDADCMANQQRQTRILEAKVESAAVALETKATVGEPGDEGIAEPPPDEEAPEPEPENGEPEARHRRSHHKS